MECQTSGRQPYLVPVLIDDGDDDGISLLLCRFSLSGKKKTICITLHERDVSGTQHSNVQLARPKSSTAKLHISCGIPFGTTSIADIQTQGMCQRAHLDCHSCSPTRWARACAEWQTGGKVRQRANDADPLVSSPAKLTLTYLVARDCAKRIGLMTHWCRIRRAQHHLRGTVGHTFLATLFTTAVHRTTAACCPEHVWQELSPRPFSFLSLPALAGTEGQNRNKQASDSGNVNRHGTARTNNICFLLLL